MSDENFNPLSKYTRMPGIHVKLPSGGKFSQPNSIPFDINGEVPVFPMRAIDELYMQSPEALVSGYAMENVLTSCIPGLQNPRDLPNSDVDVLLLAIKVATNGSLMEVTSTCPNKECSHLNVFGINVQEKLDNIEIKDIPHSTFINKEIEAFVRPYTLTNATHLLNIGFQEQKRMIYVSQNEEMNESEKTSENLEALKRITNVRMEQMYDCVQAIKTPNEMVTDKVMIRDYLMNISAKEIKAIEKLIDKHNEPTIDRNFSVQCQECEHIWTMEVTFDPANFFAGNS